MRLPKKLIFLFWLNIFHFFIILNIRKRLYCKNIGHNFYNFILNIPYYIFLIYFFYVISFTLFVNSLITLSFYLLFYDILFNKLLISLLISIIKFLKFIIIYWISFYILLHIINIMICYIININFWLLDLYNLLNLFWFRYIINV